mmetsp:Transcript_29546/g.71375  ORF Transcript_29546/g.71375 Transcript_29546/m.71375 type:complete len:98 (+) Transcript_29546:1257-1550(+)
MFVSANSKGGAIKVSMLLYRFKYAMMPVTKIWFWHASHMDNNKTVLANRRDLDMHYELVTITARVRDNLEEYGIYEYYQQLNNDVLGQAVTLLDDFC